MGRAPPGVAALHDQDFSFRLCCEPGSEERRAMLSMALRKQAIWQQAVVPAAWFAQTGHPAW